MSDHAPYAPSACFRNMKCLAAVGVSMEAEEQGKVPPPSEYAKEGTLYHDCIALLLSNKPYDKEKINEEMQEYLEADFLFTKEIKTNFEKKYGKAKEYIEQRVEYNKYLWGTLDYALVAKKDGKYYALIKDSKYGRGVPVSASNNYQLACYALCLQITLNVVFEKTYCFIYQPRTDDSPYSRWDVDKNTLSELNKQIFENLNQSLFYANSREYPYSPGDHCRFCPGRLICNGLRDYQNSTALKILDEIPEIPVCTELSIEQKIEIRKLRKTIEQLLDDVDDDLHARAMRGEKLPGLKLVNGVSRRQWKDVDTTGKALISLGVSDPFKRSLKGITEIEKEIGKGKIDDLVVFSTPKTQLVAESDKREAVSPMIMLDDIEEVTFN